MEPKRIKLMIESNLEDVPLVGIAINRFCQYACFSEADAFNIELCVIEAVTNAIKHAYSEKREREVGVTFSLVKEMAIIEICDQGTPMDPGKLEGAELIQSNSDRESIESISESGRGLGIMKEIMDEVTYRSENGFNCLTLKKSFS